MGGNDKGGKGHGGHKSKGKGWKGGDGERRRGTKSRAGAEQQHRRKAMASSERTTMALGRFWRWQENAKDYSWLRATFGAAAMEEWLAERRAAYWGDYSPVEDMEDDPSGDGGDDGDTDADDALEDWIVT